MTRIITLILFLSIAQTAVCQTSILIRDSIAVSMSAVEKFESYIDSSEKYMYSDIELTAQSLNQCEKIKASGEVIPDSIYFEYVSNCLYLHFNKLDPLSAYKVIVDNDYLLESDKVSKRQKRNFSYLENYTLMSIGDNEAAQKGYYRGIELGKTDKDTLTLVSNLYALGQLLLKDKDYKGAIEKQNEALEYVGTRIMSERNHALSLFELAAIYSDLEEYEKAIEMLTQALDIAEKNELEFIRPGLYSELGTIYIAQGEIRSAEDVYNRIKALNKNSEEKGYTENIRTLQANIFRAKGRYREALKIYDELISEFDSTKVDQLIEFNTAACEVSEEMNDFESAFRYLSACKEVEKSKSSNEKGQKIAYLKIKYDSEQKEMDNVILRAELYQNQLQSNLLYGGLAFAFVLLFGLFAALAQKARYSKRLEAKVLQRTKKLRKSNLELDELNRILAHDLKEPIRSVVSFSELAQRERSNEEKSLEYLQIVTKSGQQLNQLIDDVSTYRDLSSINTKSSVINLEVVLLSLSKEMQEKYGHKSIEFSFNGADKITSSEESLTSVFRILFDNAAMYNRNDKVVIKVGHNLKDGHHNLEVTDNGIGIEPKFQDQIFTMFKRLSNREQYSGSGLGLSMAKRIIENLNGEISILNSEMNKGTTFLVRLPEKR